MNEPALLVEAKLSPPALGPYHLVRERLRTKLLRGLDGRATLVLGGPGSGKSALVSQFVQERKLQAVWYRLDRTDSDAATFFRYLVAGLRRWAEELGVQSESIRERLAARPEEVERLADVVIRDAEESLTGRVLLVLDGVEALDDGAPATRALRRLIDYMPGTLHLLLLGRAVPELGLRALAAKGRATLIQPEELLFTLDETRALLTDVFRLRLEPAEIERLHRRTRGWVTALQLLRQTSAMGQEEADAGAASEAEIFDYFSEEVLAAESDEVREFLLATSLLPAIDPDLASEALEDLDVHLIVSRLLQRNLFITPLRGQGRLYAYDPLFRDFLQRKLIQSGGRREVLRLHRRFGEALERSGQIARALAHLGEAEDHAGVARLLARHGRALLELGLLREVRETAGVLKARGSSDGFVYDLLGEACRLAGDHAVAVRHFEQALKPPAGARALDAGVGRATARHGLAFSLLQVGEVDRAAETASAALDEVGEREPALLARLHNTLGIAHYRQGRHDEALARWNDALSRARQSGDERLTLMIAHNLGLPYAVRGDYDRAAECFRMLARADNPRAGPEEGAAHLNLARIATLRGDWAESAARLDDAGEIAQKWSLEGLAGDVLEARATLLRETGRFDEAAKTYEEARRRFTALGLRDLLDGLAEEEARLAARRGEIDRALLIAGEVVRRARAAKAPEALASALLVQGEVMARQGDPVAAEAPLAEARGLFEPIGRQFETFLADTWLALARGRRGADEAAAAARQAVELAGRHNYLAVLRRIAASEGELRRVIAALPDAPSVLDRPASALAEPEAEPAADRADLTVRLFGSVEVWRDAARKIPASAWKLRRALKIFCYLAAARGHRAMKDRLVEIAWGGTADADSVEKNFHPTISFLRRALNHGRHVPKSFIRYEAGSYVLSPSYRYDIDVERHERLIREARALRSRGEADAALAAYDEALGLHRGPFLEEEDDDWVVGPRQHHEQLHQAALAEAGALRHERGDREAAVACLEELVRTNPLDEPASARLMRVLGELGRRDAVEQEYERLAQAMDEAWEAVPSRETRRAYRSALRGNGTA